VFVGHLAYPPNVDAARTLVRAVLPLVRARHPGVRCLLAGLHPVRAVRRLALEGDDVDLLASPLDAREAWDRARMLVCPLRWGAGSRIKLLEAAARGVPIVATPTSAEGLALRPDVDYLAADGPAELAEAASALLAEPRRAQRIAEEARATVRRHHDWGCYAPRLERLYAASGSWS
jgi:glycosyltransferase involved in cell wall biosynthesis